MPEAPQMQALAERIQDAAGGRAVRQVQPLQFNSLKTFDPDPMSLRDTSKALIRAYRTDAAR